MDENKTCPQCGAILYSEEKSCPYCGTACGEAEYAEAAEASDEHAELIAETSEQSAEEKETIPQKDENIIAGIVGAFLFALGGGLLYFGIYQIGIIAGICGLVIFVLANLGYGIFCGNKDSVSTARIITAIVMTVLMILFAEYVCVAFEMFKELKSYGEYSFFDCLRIVPYVLEDKEMLGYVIKDLLFSFGLSAIAVFSTAMRLWKQRKAKVK